MNLIIRPLTSDQWPALEDLFGEHGVVYCCWCMYWRISSAYRKRPCEKNKSAFRDVVMSRPPPGLRVIDGDIVEDWC